MHFFLWIILMPFSRTSTKKMLVNTLYKKSLQIPKLDKNPVMPQKQLTLIFLLVYLLSSYWFWPGKSACCFNKTFTLETTVIKFPISGKFPRNWMNHEKGNVSFFTTTVFTLAHLRIGWCKNKLASEGFPLKVAPAPSFKGVTDGFIAWGITKGGVCIYQNSPLQAGGDTRFIFTQSKIALNSKFFFSSTGYWGVSSWCNG